MPHPVGMAGVMPITLLLASANSTKVTPKTSWYFSPTLWLVPLSPNFTKLAAACHLVCSFSAGRYPFPFTVLTCKTRGRLSSFCFWRLLLIRAHYDHSLVLDKPNQKIQTNWFWPYLFAMLTNDDSKHLN